MLSDSPHKATFPEKKDQANIRYHQLPLDEEVARVHLGRIGVKLTKLTKKQAESATSGKAGGLSKG